MIFNIVSISVCARARVCALACVCKRCVCVRGVCVCVYLISYLKVFPLFFPVLFFTIRRECISIGGRDGLSRH